MLAFTFSFNPDLTDPDATSIVVGTLYFVDGVYKEFRWSTDRLQLPQDKILKSLCESLPKILAQQIADSRKTGSAAYLRACYATPMSTFFLSNEEAVACIPPLT